MVAVVGAGGSAGSGVKDATSNECDKRRPARSSSNARTRPVREESCSNSSVLLWIWNAAPSCVGCLLTSEVNTAESWSETGVEATPRSTAGR